MQKNAYKKQMKHYDDVLTCGINTAVCKRMHFFDFHIAALRHNIGKLIVGFVGNALHNRPMFFGHGTVYVQHIFIFAGRYGRHFYAELSKENDGYSKLHR